ncbi:MAG TPA: tRNA preQ1(34) S-adenosylmethionine ribosyltransferase-isomerase QueA [Chloroflexota bacterium]|nr:tRNA preQ1(34) S-adenosylmethionine ribosyltransferase-isomerase QueA [Chloroflexota bacterium]
MRAAAEPLATELYSYELPPELIAQAPAEPRDGSRLLVLDRASGSIVHSRFRDLADWLRAGDLLVLNRSRVVPARVLGRRLADGGAAELLLLRRRAPGLWETLVRPGRRLKPGARISLGDGLIAEVLSYTPGGGRLVVLQGADDPDAAVLRAGTVPLPPYIRDWDGDPERYQTVYGDMPGSAAAPTAGLHFTPDLLERLRAASVSVAFVTLHVGLDTFRPVRSESLTQHEIHAEECTVAPETIRAVQAARSAGGKVVAVGTSTVRALETALAYQGTGQAASGWSGATSLYILPGHRFRAVDVLITNFHVPRSTLLALVSAFAGRALVLAAYREAIAHRYRFLSFGDAMLVA